MAKKKQVDPAGLKAYSKGVGKFINPNLKKKAQKIDDEDLATPVVKKKKQFGSKFSLRGCGILRVILHYLRVDSDEYKSAIQKK